VNATYYAMLYAARAALSEEDLYAKTHKGVWRLFSERFVASGRFERALFAEAQRAQELRLLGDYEARDVPSDEAKAIVEEAERFVAAVSEMLGA
jgi:uncharacterized protein (UPF0332 family)